jgi:hypothetical protein
LNGGEKGIMANKYAIDYKITLKVISTDQGTAKQIADNYVNGLPTSGDTVSEIVSDFEDIQLVSEEE